MTGTLRLRPDRRNYASREELARRVYGEFTEMPCLRLTGGQAQRLFALSPEVCDRVLSGLVGEGLLTRGPDGRYRLHDADSVSLTRKRVR